MQRAVQSHRVERTLCTRNANAPTGESDMNWDILKSNWKQFKDRLKARCRSWAMAPIAPIVRPGQLADSPAIQPRSPA